MNINGKSNLPTIIKVATVTGLITSLLFLGLVLLKFPIDIEFIRALNPICIGTVGYLWFMNKGTPYSPPLAKVIGILLGLWVIGFTVDVISLTHNPNWTPIIFKLLSGKVELEGL